MGQIHHWEIKKPLTKHELTMISTGVKKLINKTDVSICGPGGVKDPIITSYKIGFNGNINNGEDFDTFMLEKDVNYNGTYPRCNTMKQPYDSLVLATLILLKYYKKEDVIVAPDGTEEDWKDGIKLAKEILPRKEVDETVEAFHKRRNKQ